MKFIVLVVLLTIPFLIVYGDTKDKIKQDLADMINQYRMNNGLEPWEYDLGIEKVALAHSEDMAKRDYFSHTTKGTNVDSSLRGAKAGYGLCGESYVLELWKKANEFNYQYMKNYRDYNKKLERFELTGSTDPILYAELKILYDENEKIRERINQLLNQVEANGGIRIGLSENIAYFENYLVLDTPRETMNGWIASPKHNELLLGHGDSMGIGLEYYQNKVYVTLNVC